MKCKNCGRQIEKHGDREYYRHWGTWYSHTTSTYFTCNSGDYKTVATPIEFSRYLKEAELCIK